MDEAVNTQTGELLPNSLLEQTTVSVDFDMHVKEGKLFDALSKFQKEMKHPQKNVEVKYTFQGRTTQYKYATLDSCITENQELLGKCGLSVTQFPITRGGKVGVITILAHSGGEYLSGSFLVKPENEKAQQLGSAITYLRRYSYSAVLGFASEPDDDGASASGQGKKPEGKPEEKPAQKTLVPFIEFNSPNPYEPSKKKIHANQKAIKEQLDSAKTIERVLALWTELTESQQENTNIKGMFTRRKTQLNNEKQQKEKALNLKKDANTFIKELNAIDDYKRLQKWYSDNSASIMQLEQKDYDKVAEGLEKRNQELKSIFD